MATQRERLNELRSLQQQQGGVQQQNQRQRLEQLRALSGQQGAQDGISTTGGVGVPGPNGVAIQEQQAQRLEALPELGRGGLLAGQDPLTGAAITPALLTTTDPREVGQILTTQFPGVIGITETKEGELIATNNETGAKVSLNKPGLSQLDIVQGLGLAAAFTPAARVATTGALVAGTAITSGINEAVQALSGGEFNAEQVAIDAVTVGLLDKAFEVAKATGRSIQDVLRKDVGVDPEAILKTFRPDQRVTSTFATQPVPPSGVGATLEKISQEGITPEALQRIRQAEQQGIQLTRAQALQKFGPAEAEQTLLKSISPEGERARQFVEGQQEQLKSAADVFTQKFGGSARFKEAIGESVEDTARGKGELIQDVLLERKELGRKEVSELYTLAGETAGDALPLNNSSIVEISDDVIVNRPITPEVEKSINTALAKFGLIGDSVEKSTRNKFKVLDGDQTIIIAGDVTPLTLSNAEDFRKALNKAVGADQTGSAKLVVSELDKQIATIVEQGVESGRTGAFKTAREAAREQFETFSAKDIVEDLTSFKRGTSTPKLDPETVINKIAKGDKSVTNIRKVKSVLLTNSTKQTRQAWRSIQAEAVGDILGQAINKDTLDISGARLNSAMKKFKPEALRELLGKKKFTELKNLQKIIGNATIAPPGTTNPSGTFLRFLNLTERLGNFAGAGQINFGSIAVESIKKGQELSNRKKVLDGLVNTQIKRLKASDPGLAKNKSALNKTAKILALLEVRQLDKEDK
jgi:hypothetical protein